MGKYTIYKNSNLTVNATEDYIDNGWEISEGIATHYPCNAGYMSNPSLNIVVGETYVIEYDVLNYFSGIVRTEIGNLGSNHNTAGHKKDTITATSNTVRFYSDGYLSVQNVNIYPYTTTEDNAVTFVFNEDLNKWTGDRSIHPEVMVKFIDEMFVFKDGQLWLENANQIHNNFFGEQFTSKVTIVVNADFRLNKIFSNLRLDGKGKWSVTKMTVLPTDQFPKGMESRLTENNFKLIDGKLWADILRDMNDPAFASITDINQRKLRSLFKGREMQGCILIIDLECTSTDEARLSSVETYYFEANRSL